MKAVGKKFLRSYRLLNARQFKAVWDKAKRLSGQGVALVNCRNELEHCRLGLSFSKRHFSRAVDRNRLKRVARETFRLNQDKLMPCDVVAVGYRGAELLTPTEQYQLFNQLWERLAKSHKKSQSCC